MELRDRGSGCSFCGKRIGGIKVGHFRRDSSARASTISNVPGHLAYAGSPAGRACMYSGLRLRMKSPKPDGKQSRSKTKECSNCPYANGMIIQLPTQSGFPRLPQIPFSSAAL